MKFGQELDNRSVVKWKHNNIHYNDLKHRIKIATTVPRMSVSSESSGTSGTGTTVSGSVSTSSSNDKQKLYLRELYKSFGKEIEFLNLFISTEYSKNTHLLLVLRHKLESFLSMYSQHDNANIQEPSQSYIKTKNKTFLRCCNDANTLLNSFNDLSQFISLQKLLLRKLFKKFIKYSPLSNKQEFVQHIESKYLQGNTKSFVNIDLNDAIQELSLIIDVLNSINSNQNVSPINLIADPNLTKDIKFDVLSSTKCFYRRSFLVHPDYLNELKIYLLKEFNLICNDEGKNDLSYLRRTASHLNLRQQNQPRSPAIQSQSDYFQPDSRLTKMILGPLVLDQLHSTICEIPGGSDRLLIAKVGGFKNISYSKISEHMFSILMTSDTPEQKLEEIKKLLALGDRADLSTINWALGRSLDVLFRLRYTRTRFITASLSDNSSKKESFYITLDANINTEEPDGEFPHSVLTISYESLSSTIPSNVLWLMNSHLVYPEPLDFSLVNYFMLKHGLVDTSIPEWMQDIDNGKEIKKMPPETTRRSSSLEPPKGILINKKDTRSTHKYWNEFDNGSDFEDNDEGFYVYDNTADGLDETGPLLSANRVDNILRVSNRVLSFFQYLFDHSVGKLMVATEDPKGGRIYHESHSYGSISSDTENDSDYDDEDDEAHLSSKKLKRIHSPPYHLTLKHLRTNKDFRQRVQYDKVLTLLYFFLEFTSVLVDGIAIGILYTVLLAHGNPDLTPGVGGTGSALIFFVFACFVVALILSIGGMCFIGARYQEPPTWHYGVAYFVLFLDLGVICLGMSLASPYII